jgi:hypothetical protein
MPREKLEGFTKVDPTEEPEIRQYRIQVPDSFTFSRPQSELVYDRPSDTMLVLFYGRYRVSFVDYVVGDYAVLLDINTDELVGLQIEDFLFSAVKDQPSLITLLDHAELLGMTVAEVRDERQRALGYRGRFKLWLERLVDEVSRRGESNQQDAVEEILNRAQTSSIIRIALGST